MVLMKTSMSRILKTVFILCILMASTKWIVFLLSTRYGAKEGTYTTTTRHLPFKHDLVRFDKARLKASVPNATRIRTVITTSAKAIHSQKINGSEIKARRKVMEVAYYHLSPHKLNPHNFDFLITGEHICTKSPYLLIMIPSIHEHTGTRKAIRETWGQIAINETWPHETVSFRSKLIFLFGKGKTTERDQLIQEESKKYGDVIQGNFVDAYKNLTRKILMGLKWISRYCSEVDYILKADEDVFVHIPNMILSLQKRKQHLKGTIYGYIIQEAKVRRQGKWSVSKKEFPLTYYPQYASGNSYVMTGNIAPRLFMVSEYMPYMPVEDAFITGVLAKMTGVEHEWIPGFTYWLQRSPDPCSFLRPDKVSATRVTVQKMYEIWKTLRDRWICQL